MITKDLVICSLFAAIISICAQISIPLPGGVPFTFQILGVAVAGMLLGAKKGFISVLIYLIIGAVGLPVFAGFSGGLQAIVGPTGGFLFSFPLMAYIIGFICEKNDKIVMSFLSMAVGLVVVYTVGTLYFSMITGHNIATSLTYCVIPFVGMDSVKLVIATAIANRLKNHKSIKNVLQINTN